MFIRGEPQCRTGSIPSSNRTKEDNTQLGKLFSIDSENCDLCEAQGSHSEALSHQCSTRNSTSPMRCLACLLCHPGGVTVKKPRTSPGRQKSRSLPLGLKQQLSQTRTLRDTEDTRSCSSCSPDGNFCHQRKNLRKRSSWVTLKATTERDGWCFRSAMCHIPKAFNTSKSIPVKHTPRQRSPAAA